MVPTATSSSSRQSSQARHIQQAALASTARRPLWHRHHQLPSRPHPCRSLPMECLMPVAEASPVQSDPPVQPVECSRPHTCSPRTSSVDWMNRSTWIRPQCRMIWIRTWSISSMARLSQDKPTSSTTTESTLTSSWISLIIPMLELKGKVSPQITVVPKNILKVSIFIYNALRYYLEVTLKYPSEFRINISLACRAW